jgi:hypothetical protein
MPLEMLIQASPIPYVVPFKSFLKKLDDQKSITLSCTSAFEFKGFAIIDSTTKTSHRTTTITSFGII